MLDNNFFLACFNEYLSHRRFEDVYYISHQTICATAGSTAVEFSLPAQTTNRVYLFNEHVLEIHLRMVKKDGTALPDKTLVAPVNNIIDSLFDNVTIKLNSTNINPRDQKYAYRAYLSKLLSYNNDAKQTWLQAEGWYEDELLKYHPPNFDALSYGTLERRFLFMKGRDGDAKSATTFDNTYVKMYGRVYSDLQGSDCGILSGVSINILMTFAPDSFRIVSKKLDQDVKIEVDRAILHMPMATLSPAIYNAIEHKLSKTPAKIFYKRTELSHYTVNKDTQSYDVSINSSTAGGPCRVFIAFVTLRQFNGVLDTNPYYFARRWKSNAGSFWIKSVNISLNGRPLDCLHNQATEFDDQASYVRLMKLQGLTGSNQGCGISYNKWRDNSAIFGFDLSTSGKCGETSDFLIPVVKTGDTRVEVIFGGLATSVEMKMLVFCELPSVMEIRQDRSLNFSYFTSAK